MNEDGITVGVGYPAMHYSVADGASWVCSDGTVWTDKQKAGLHQTSIDLVAQIKAAADKFEKLKNAQWEIEGWNVPWGGFEYTEAEWELVAQANMYPTGDGGRDALLISCLESNPAHAMVRVTRGQKVNLGAQLQPWKQMFIGYAHNALEWAKEVTGEE